MLYKVWPSKTRYLSIEKSIAIRLRIFITLFLLLAVTVLVYLASLDGPFVFDDQTTIGDSRYMRHPEELLNFSLKEHVIQRSVSRLSLWLTKWRTNSLEPRAFHVIDLILHLVNGLLIFLFSRLIVLHAIKKKLSSVSALWLPLIVAMIFLLHPIQTQAVNYASQRMAQLEVLFNLIALVGYFRFRTNERLNPNSYLFFGVFLLSSALALLSKGNAATIPFQLLALEAFVLVKTNQRKKWRLTWAALIIISIMVALFIVPLPVDSVRLSRLDYLLTQPWVILNYLRLLFVPIYQSFDHVIPYWYDLHPVIIGVSVLVHLALLSLGVLVAKKRPLTAFGIWFFYLSLLIESSVIPLKDLMVEHRLYLPVIGFSFVISDLLSRLQMNARIIASGTLLVLLSGITWQRNQDWKTEWSLWQSALDIYTNSDFALTQQANALLKQKDSTLAGIYLDSAIAVDPTNVTALSSRALMFIEQGEYYDALNRLNRIYQLEPHYTPALLNHGYLEERLRRPREAAKKYNQAAAYCKGCGEPHLYLGTLYLNQNKLALAEKHFRMAEDKGFVNARLLNNHGYLKLIQKDTTMAVTLFKRSISLKPDYTNPMMSLGKISLARKDSLSANYYFINIISTDTANREAARLVSLTGGQKNLASRPK